MAKHYSLENIRFDCFIDKEKIYIENLAILW